jgi:hypothetical protein
MVTSKAERTRFRTTEQLNARAPYAPAPEPVKATLDRPRLTCAHCASPAAGQRDSIRRSRSDAVEKRVLRQGSIHPRSSVSCAVVTLRTRFTPVADHGADSRASRATLPVCSCAAVAHTRDADRRSAAELKTRNREQAEALDRPTERPVLSPHFGASRVAKGRVASDATSQRCLVGPRMRSDLMMEANGARWPSRSSKPVARRFAGRLGSTPRRFRHAAVFIARLA